MNILDMKDVTVPEGDLLGQIFAGQRELMAKYHDIEKGRGALVIEGEDFGELDLRKVQWRLKDLAYRVVEELSEATNCLKNKPWKQTEVETDKAHFYEELADAFHFFIELCITAGMDAEDLAILYHQKHAVNQFRQRSAY
jgi:dimeric dUTPase (all-alpha-NTP-PPase superfamily)